MFANNDDIQACLETLQKGGLILYPTDTVWGIGCDATNETARKLYDTYTKESGKIQYRIQISSPD
jgi:L-threonylcarbamoyladenylate synthase